MPTASYNAGSLDGNRSRRIASADMTDGSTAYSLLCLIPSCTVQLDDYSTAIRHSRIAASYNYET